MASYLIVAGTSDIGFNVAQKLMSAGHNVFITGRDETKTTQIAEQLNLPFGLLDATDFKDVDSIVQYAKKQMGSLYGIVNCAGSLLLKPAHLTTQNEYENTISANLTTSFSVVAAAGKHLTKEGGSVVLFSSAAALSGFSNHEAIAAAKGGIISLALSASATYANNNIRFNVVAPGLVQTKLTVTVMNNPLSRKASEAMHALGRLGTPQDIASAVTFFLNPENSWVTGQVLAIDGGLSRVHPKMKM